MQKILFATVALISASTAWSEAAVKVTNDLNESIYKVRINDEAFEIKGGDKVKAGDHKSFDIIHTPDEKQPLVREEKDQITEIRFQTGKGKNKVTYSCKLPEPVVPPTWKDIEITASTCQKLEAH